MYLYRLLRFALSRACYAPYGCTCYTSRLKLFLVHFWVDWRCICFCGVNTKLLVYLCFYPSAAGRTVEAYPMAPATCTLRHMYRYFTFHVLQNVISTTEKSNTQKWKAKRGETSGCAAKNVKCIHYFELVVSFVQMGTERFCVVL